MANKLSPAQRALLFAQATRKYEQLLPAQNFVEGSTLQFQLPKARFLSKISLIVKGTYKVAHASKTSFTKTVFDRYNLIKRIRMNINNGFNPYDISGNMLAMYNMTNRFSKPDSDPFGVDVVGNTVSSGGTTNTVQFTVELPNTINDRDPVGLILLQNEQTIVSLNIDLGKIADMMTDTDITISNVSLTVQPVIETFSIPVVPDAIPDYSILKLVNEQSENIVSTNEMTVRLPIGLTYRKFFVYLASDTAYTPIDPSKVSYFSLVFNQADTPIQVPAEYVAYKNWKDYDGQIPKGCYVFSFDTQGIANMGGGRDYVDTERLTEFWLKVGFNGLSGSSNYIYVVSEKLAKLS